MSTNPFRESGDINRTEIECTRIREAETTRRKQIEEVELTRRQRIEQREETRRKQPELYGFLGIFRLGIVVALCVAAWAVTSNYFESRSINAGMCHDEIIPMGSLSVRCDHPQHVSKVIGDRLFCTCRGNESPAASNESPASSTHP